MILSSVRNTLLESLPVLKTRRTLSLTCKYLANSAKLYSPFGCSGHNLIDVSCSIAPMQSHYPPKKRCVCHYTSFQWDDLRMYYSNFLLKDYCFQIRNLSVYTQSITELIFSVREGYILCTLSPPNAPPKLWINHSCSRAINVREKLTKGIWVFQLMIIMFLYFCPESCQIYPMTYQKLFH